MFSLLHGNQRARSPTAATAGAGRNSPGTDHATGALLISSHGFRAHEVLEDFLFAVLEANVGQAVLVGDDLVRDAAEAEDEGADDAGPVLAGGAVDEQRGRGPVGGGEVGEDGAEGVLRMVLLRGGAENVGVRLDETLRVVEFRS